MGIDELKGQLRVIREPRRESGNYRHKLEDILIIGLCTVICMGEDYVDMEDFGKEREEWLRGFLELPNGIPDSDTFRRVFERVDSTEVSKALSSWLGGDGSAGGRTVNIDGKTIRGSGGVAKKALHVVSAWVHENEITLGEVATAQKSNEITAIPELLDLIDIRGDIVTIDAMGCQRDIARKIREKEADYLLALKENQSNLYEDVQTYFQWLEKEKPASETYQHWSGRLEKGHGRLEKRDVTIATSIDWLENSEHWLDLHTLVQYRCTRESCGIKTVTDRYYISSFDTDAEGFAYLLRNHWSIENRLHWKLDVLFREDGARARKDHSPLNMNVLRKIAMAMLAVADHNKRIGTRKKMLRAALNPVFLSRVLFSSV